MRVFVVFLDAEWSGWDHHIIALDDDVVDPEAEALKRAKAKSKLMKQVSELKREEVTEMTSENDHVVIAGGP